jgi:hypothetical protein
MKIVSNWRECHRWVSMHCMMISASIQGAWLALPDDLKATIPPMMASGAALGILILGMLGRLVDQSRPE